MKKSLSLGITCLMTACALLSTMRTNAQNYENEAIKKAVQQETLTYFHKDYDGWTKTWLHDTADYILRAGANGSQQVHGWNNIAAEYKQAISNLPVLNDAEIAPFLHKTDYQIYINGNTATVTFKEGDKTTNTEARTLVKQGGAWKILNFTLIDNSAYAMMNTINNMKAFAGKWILDGKATMEPSNGGTLNSLKFNLKITSQGLAQFSNFSFSNNNQSYAPPTETEYFIPDYASNTVTYMDIYKNPSGHTLVSTGKVTSTSPNSFTVTIMYPDMPTVVQDQYTVTMQEGKWHQVNKKFSRDGKQTQTSTVNLRRAG